VVVRGFFLIGGIVTLGSLMFGYHYGRAYNTPIDWRYKLAHTPLAFGLLFLGPAVFGFISWPRYLQRHFICETCGKWIDIQQKASLCYLLIGGFFFRGWFYGFNSKQGGLYYCLGFIWLRCTLFQTLEI
jgi:hypothetical protein